MIREMKALGASIFLDLKFHDIPAPVAGAVRAAAAMGVGMMTIHTSGGLAMMRSAAEAAAEGSARPGAGPSPRAVALEARTFDYPQPTAYSL